MYFEQELLKLKNKIGFLAFQKSFYCVKETKEPIYCLIAIDKDGYRMQTAYGMAIDIVENDIKETLSFIKNNGFKIHEHSLFK